MDKVYLLLFGVHLQLILRTSNNHVINFDGVVIIGVIVVVFKTNFRLHRGCVLKLKGNVQFSVLEIPVMSSAIIIILEEKPPHFLTQFSHAINGHHTDFKYPWHFISSGLRI